VTVAQKPLPSQGSQEKFPLGSSPESIAIILLFGRETRQKPGSQFLVILNKAKSLKAIPKLNVTQNDILGEAKNPAFSKT
jgi:hypothetical protein